MATEKSRPFSVNSPLNGTAIIDHILIDHLAQPHAGVVSLCDDVDEDVADNKFESHVLMRAKEVGQ